MDPISCWRFWSASLFLFLSIMQVAETSATSTTTTYVNGVATTQVVKAVAANVFFMKDAISVGIRRFSCGLIGLVLAVVLIANATGSEYGWNTMRPYLLCSESRAKVVTSKLIASSIFIVAAS